MLLVIVRKKEPVVAWLDAGQYTETTVRKGPTHTQSTCNGVFFKITEVRPQNPSCVTMVRRFRRRGIR